MRKLLYALGLVVAASSMTTATAQNEASTLMVGARLGVPLSASAKYFISDADAIEAYVGIRGSSVYNWININGAYLRHQPLGLDGELAPLNWYFGGGAGVYIFSYDLGPLFDESDFSTTAIAISGYVGLQYPFSDIPLEITLDWSPSLFLGNGFVTGFEGGQGAVGVRYILGR